MNLLSSPPEHKNPKLEEIIKKNQGQGKLDLSHNYLSNDDMEIVAYYLAQNDKVSDVTFF
jgi:hypothetical protein